MTAPIQKGTGAGMTAAIQIRRIQLWEWEALRDIRLRAIRDTPDAFAISLAETLAQSEEGWTAWATRCASGETNVMYVGDNDGTWIAMAAGMLAASQPPTTPQIAELISMWVDPRYRGRGLGGHLVEHVVGWARDRGARQLELWATENNGAAIALYSRCGFRTVGESQPLPSNPALREQRMVRSLGATSAGAAASSC